MADVVILGDLTLSSAPYGISVDNGHDFLEPAPQLTMRPRAFQDGDVLVKKRYPNVVRTLVVNISSSDGTKDSLNANLRAIQTELRKLDVGESLVLQYTPNGGTVDNFSDVISGSRQTALDWFYVERNEIIKATIKLECKPFWRGTQITIAQQTFAPTPAVLTASTVQGDIETPVFVEIQGSSNGFGNDLYVGSRQTPITESLFDPIKDFQGNATGGTFNGEYAREAISTGFTNLTGDNTNLNGASFTSTGVGWSVGDAGLIQKTSDSGNNWVTQASTITSQNLLSVHFPSVLSGYVVGQNGIILATSDSGVTWNNVSPSTLTSKNLADVYFGTTSVGWAVGTDGTVLRTINSGSSWIAQSLGGANPQLRGVVSNSSLRAWCCGSDGSTGTIYRTTDSGVTWNTVTQSVTQWQGIWFSNNNSGWVVGPNGDIRNSTDGGATFPNDQRTGVVNFRRIEMSTGSTTIGWIVGDNGEIRNTTNGGATWNQQTSNTAANLHDLSVVNSNNVYVVGTGYETLRTDDGGTTWTQPQTSWSLSSVEDYRGRYRVFARVRSQSADPTTVSVRVSSGFAGGTAIANDAVVMTVATDTWEVLDLGEINIPITRVSDEIDPTPIITIEALDTSGATNFDIDVAVLLPLDGEAVFVDSNATQAQFITLDSEKNAINKGFTKVDWNGSPPLLRPGLKNNIVILETSTGTNGGINDALVTMKYFARFLSPESSG